MRLRHRIRHYWHEFYYAICGGQGIDFAMRCKDVTAKIDLGEIPEDFIGLLRFRLHLSLCSACHFYSVASGALKKMMRDFVSRSEKSLNIELLNQKLLKKYSR
jgi:hypothetical protein